ncbi:MAG TPA: hypothetical protein VGZ52_10435 [Acidimicrobiales bacterium]|nr:hypothetical protein [Acidimicrobiales bacterium]
MSGKVYIHELIDIRGANRAKYLHHMTANWCPIAREERNQLCYGVWGTVGSTGRWPEVVNMWELDGWDGLAANFEHELTHPGMQDPSLREWWSVAATLRRGGVDRILEPAAWARSIDDLVAANAGGAFYAQELIRVAAGENRPLLDALETVGRPTAAALGVGLLGGFRVAMADDREAIAIWTFPDWPTWVAYEQAWSETGAMAPWRAALLGRDARFRRTLMVDAPLAPLRTGRQPQAEDRRPLDEI